MIYKIIKVGTHKEEITINADSMEASGNYLVFRNARGVKDDPEKTYREFWFVYSAADMVLVE